MISYNHKIYFIAFSRFLLPRKIPIWVFIALILSNKNHFYYTWVIKICLLSREEHCRWPTVLFNKTHSHLLRLTLNRWPTVLFNKTHSHLLRLTHSGRPSRANCANLRTTPLLYPNTPELVDYLYLFGGFLWFRHNLHYLKISSSALKVSKLIN